jgi:putative ABC transport system substrate-binding protein
MKEAGYIDGQNVRVEYRWAEGHYDRLPAFAADFVKSGVAVIIAAGGSDPGRAARAATSTIPIVFITAADPVETGLVQSLNRPEANVTGIGMLGALLEAKRLELLHEVVPQAAVIGVLINPNYPAAKAQTREVEEAASRLGLQLVLREAATPADIDAAFAVFAERKIAALLIGNDPFFGSQREKLAALAIREKLPAISFRREFAEAGGLLSYGPLFVDGYRQTGLYAGKILKGTKPADLPVMQPTKFELVVNLRTAKAMGLAISEAFLLRADEIME